MTDLSVRIRDAAVKCDDIFRTEDQMLSRDPAFVMVADLTKRSKEVICISPLWIEEYCSGPALGARLWADFASDGEEDPVVITAHPSDVSTTSSIVFKSPLTGGLFVNTVTGNLGRSIRQCGCVALVLRGRMSGCGVVEITPEGGSFQAIERFCGFTTDNVAIQLKHSSFHSVLCIGPAGERKLLNAICVCDGHSTGRGGLGCVLGRKNLKAISIRGDRDSELTAVKEPDIPFVRISDYMGWAPVENFTGRSDPRLFHISLNEFARILSRKNIHCEVPPFESVLMLGSNTGCFDAVKVVDRYRRCISLGIDPVFVGNYLGAYRCGYDDEVEINACITSLASSEVDIGSLYSVNGMTAGCFDYRGNQAQALSDASGFWFALFFAAGKDLATTSQAYWASFAEDITLGLLSMGMSLSGLFERAFKVNSVQTLAMRFCPSIAEKVFSPDDESLKLSKALDADIDSNYIVNLGCRCKRLFYEINQALDAYQNPSIPDHFCIDPESNMKELDVVPFNSLMDSYVSIRNLLFAKQDSKAAKSR